MTDPSQLRAGGGVESTISSIYRDKPQSYFGNARDDIVALLPTGPQGWILELGCGAGATGRAARAAGKAGRYVGLELNAQAAAVAAEHLSEVLVGDVETLDLSRFEGRFDVLIVSEVLEHLTDPWSTLARLADCLKPGGRLFASSPNIAHWGVIRNLLRGRFRYGESGVMDRTHLRWFTPESFRELIENAGFEIVSIGPATPLRWKARLLDGLSAGRLRHLVMTQMLAVGRRL